jgi:hypothetical protein
MGELRKYCEGQVRDYCDEQDITLTPEEFDNAVNGVEYWVQENIQEAVSDSVSTAKY